ncbi:MAG: excinuclease ABC subunit UvrA [Euryarchaeota archaeon]|nr:excinuclease ABC subunit UvrA [Euryarchaeota archaeon]
MIKGAREHNLKNIDLTLPRNKLVVVTGLSGSGKSSLAFDTIYAEGQRRYVESLSAYARQFLGQMEKPDVDSIDGLSPAISIDQKAAGSNPRSTVGTITEIYDYLRLLYAHVGIPHCTNCGRVVRAQTAQEIVEQALKLPAATKVQVLSPVVRSRKGEYKKVFADYKAKGFERVRVNGKYGTVDDVWGLARYEKHTIEIVVDRLVVAPDAEERLNEAVESAMTLSGNVVTLATDKEDLTFSGNFACPDCGVSLPEIAPRSFSFNSPHGACPSCLGLGISMEIDPGAVIKDPSMSLRQGCFDWKATRMHTWIIREIENLARHYKFDLDTPWEKLPEKAREMVLYGSDEKFHQRYEGKGEKSNFLWESYTEYEGLIPRLERLFKESGSQGVREDISELMSTKPCGACRGKRLRPEILAVTIQEKSIHDMTAMPVERLLPWFETAEARLTDRQRKIAKDIVKEIRERLRFMANVGLEYLTLDRASGTLSGGEAQRIRLATQVGSGLVGVLYILDEPSIGLHQRDNERLIGTLKGLRDLGNTLIVVEHDEGMIRAADYVVDLGPGAGEQGGHVVAQGTPKQVEAAKQSLTGRYLSGRESVPVPERRRKGNGRRLTVKRASENNLKKVTVTFPLGLFNCVTGVSGSGKSTLVTEVLYKALARRLNLGHEKPGEHAGLDGVEHVDKVIIIDQSPIGRTPRSNPATYTGAFTPIRDLLAAVPESRKRGFKPGRFSFNVQGGRCEACEGGGMVKIEMHFLADVYVHCDVCKGARYNRETLEIKYKGKNIKEILDMSVSEALPFFAAIASIRNKLQTLEDVGLGYIKLGQPAPTLSGGEAQRIKLASELSKRATGKTVYILDEPTTGLHFDDIRKLLGVLNRLVDAGNTLIVIEHNLDVIKTADWITDLGPDGGERGGYVVAEGTPEEVAASKTHTAQFLQPTLAAGKHRAKAAPKGPA